MSSQVRESLSALMDGEAEELELRRLLDEKSAEHSEYVDETWSRYQLIRESMHGIGQGAGHTNEYSAEQDTAFRQLDISQQVAQAIRDEQPAVAAPDLSRDTDQTTGSSWLKPVAGFAVAASVAMAVVVGVQSVQQTTPGVNAPATVQAQVASRVYPVVGNSLRAADGTSQQLNRYANTTLPDGFAARQAAADLEAQRRLDQYMLRHTERAALNNNQGMMSFARVASFEAE